MYPRGRSQLYFLAAMVAATLMSCGHDQLLNPAEDEVHAGVSEAKPSLVPNCQPPTPLFSPSTGYVYSKWNDGLVADADEIYYQRPLNTTVTNSPHEVRRLHYDFQRRVWTDTRVFPNRFTAAVSGIPYLTAEVSEPTYANGYLAFLAKPSGSTDPSLIVVAMDGGGDVTAERRIDIPTTREVHALRMTQAVVSGQNDAELTFFTDAKQAATVTNIEVHSGIASAIMADPNHLRLIPFTPPNHWDQILDVQALGGNDFLLTAVDILGFGGGVQFPPTNLDGGIYRLRDVGASSHIVETWFDRPAGGSTPFHEYLGDTLPGFAASFASNNNGVPQLRFDLVSPSPQQGGLPIWSINHLTPDEYHTQAMFSKSPGYADPFNPTTRSLYLFTFNSGVDFFSPMTMRLAVFDPEASRAIDFSATHSPTSAGPDKILAVGGNWVLHTNGALPRLGQTGWLPVLLSVCGQKWQ